MFRLQEKEMAKGKAKNSSVSLAPPQPRSLRSRKRDCPRDEISETHDVQATHYQDTEGHGAKVDATLLQCPLQESSMLLIQQPEVPDQSCLTKQDPDTEEKHAEARNVTVKSFEEQEVTTIANPNSDSQLKGFRLQADNDVNNSGKDQEDPFAALEEQPGAKENFQCHLEKKQQASEEEPSNTDMADVKEITKEAAAGLPAKKKRRMGMCGLTERERSHFLQTQKRENGQNGPESTEKQICVNTVGLVAHKMIISSSSSLPIPVGGVTEQDEAEMKLQSSHCGGVNRAETEVHIATTTSDGTSAASDRGCSTGKSCDVEGITVPGLEQTGDTKPDPSAQEELLKNQEQQECDGGTAEIVAEKPQEQMKDGEDGSAAIDQSPAITFYSNHTGNEETENQDAFMAVVLQVNNLARTRDEKKRELTSDAGDGAETGASSTDTRSGGFHAVELCEAAATPSGSERKHSCDSDVESGAGPSTVNAEPPQTGDTTDLFGSGYLDYVSDSQLNTIVLIEEEEKVERKEDLDYPDHEDATDLICGLIRELSSLNRKVMATHRELENLRRSSKSSRSSTR